MFKYHCSSLDGLPSRHVLRGCRNYGLRLEAAGRTVLAKEGSRGGGELPTTEVREVMRWGVGMRVTACAPHGPKRPARLWSLLLGRSLL